MAIRIKTEDLQFPKFPERFEHLREEERHLERKLFNCMVNDPFGIPPVIGNPPTMFISSRIPIRYFCGVRSGYDCHYVCHFPFKTCCQMFTARYDRIRTLYYTCKNEEEREGLKMEMIQFLRRIKDGINLNYRPFIKRNGQ